MENSLLLGLFVIIAVSWQPMWATRDFDIRWQSINCTVIDPNMTNDFQCTIIEMAKKQGNFLNTRWILRNELRKMWVELSVGVLKERGSGVQQLIKVRVDGCNLGAYRSKNRALNAVLKKLLQSGNYPKSCPFLANVNYTSTRFALNPDHFPAYMPDMKFNTKIDIYSDKNVALIKASANVEVIRRQS